MTGSIFSIRSSRIDLFRDHPLATGSLQRKVRVAVRSYRALETDPDDGDCRPHTPTNEVFRRPLRGIATDQGCVT